MSTYIKKFTTKLPQEDVNGILHAYQDERYTVAEIADAYHTSIGTVSKIARSNGLSRRKDYNKSYSAKESILEALGEILDTQEDVSGNITEKSESLVVITQGDESLVVTLRIAPVGKNTIVPEQEVPEQEEPEQAIAEPTKKVTGLASFLDSISIVE